jgi:hypothetical protein
MPDNALKIMRPAWSAAAHEHCYWRPLLLCVRRERPSGCIAHQREELAAIQVDTPNWQQIGFEMRAVCSRLSLRAHQ